MINIGQINEIPQARRIPKISFRAQATGGAGVKPEFDISYYNKYPLNVLCNFMPSCFEFDGVQVKSMEGFLQSLKVKNPEVQKRICKLAAPHAKRVGDYLKKTGQYDGEHLYWQGKVINRHGQKYQELLDRVYLQKFQTDENFRNILLQTKGYNLTHTIGKTSENETILTEKEFINRLVTLRDNELRGRISCKNVGKIFKLSKSNPCGCEIDLGKIENTHITKLRAYNGRIVCGKEVLGKAQEEALKKAGVNTVIDLYNDKVSTKSNYSSKLEHYNFPINDDGAKMPELAEKLPELIDFINTKNSYIFCKRGLSEANTALAANYLFNPKAMFSEAILWGGIDPNGTMLKKMDGLQKALTSKTKEQLGWGNDFENEFLKRKRILIEMNPF